MTPEDIKVGHTYRTVIGSTMRVIEEKTISAHTIVVYLRNKSQLRRYRGLQEFAWLAVEDITESQ